MSINQAVVEQRKIDAESLAQNPDKELTLKQAKHVAFWRWLVQSRKVTGDLARDVTGKDN